MKNGPQFSDETFLEARNLYWTGWTIQQLHELLEIPYGTLDSRKRREGWDKASPIEKAKACLDIRYRQLILKDAKTGADFQEMEALGKQIERMARVEKFQETKKDSDLNPKIKKRNEGKQKKKNAISDEMAVKLLDDFHDSLFGYQKTWYDAKHNRVRNILKSRQIGATWYFAREAFADALETGDNQIFLSASKAQAHIFKAYIIAWVFEVTGVELKGDPIVLPNGAQLIFLSTSSRTAQGYHGHVYMDEYFWIPKFQEFKKVASGMAMHKKWRKTFFSTPSTLNHEAYPFWTGKEYNKGRAKKDQIEVDVSHEALKRGRVCEDGQWRQIVTVIDAAENGCTLFDIDELRLEYSPEDFENLLMCQFVDDAASVFRFEDLARCGIDAMASWSDFNPNARRPFGSRPVWIGYDPSRSQDNASLAVIAPPDVPGGKFRVLEKFSWSNIDFDTQSKKIKQLTKRYNVTKIAIDASGIGQGVFELVKEFFPQAIQIKYSLEVKSRLVLKLIQMVNQRRVQWDVGLKEIPMAFMTIKRTITPKGGQTTFKASRTGATGHADVAWAIMHAFEGEALQSAETEQSGNTQSFMEIC